MFDVSQMNIKNAKATYEEKYRQQMIDLIIEWLNVDSELRANLEKSTSSNFKRRPLKDQQ